MDTTTNDFIADDRSWQKVIMKYNRPDLSKSLWQICNSLIPLDHIGTLLHCQWFPDTVVHHFS